MSGPLWQAVESYRQKDMARFHMPGHKGASIPPFGELLSYDITEVRGADSLYEASEAIAQTEERYRALYGSAGSFLSAGGSTLCIQAMLALAVPEGSRILCARGVHTAAVNAMALLDLHPHWIFPETDPGTGLALAVTAGMVEAELERHPGLAAVYLTSPNFFGVISDIPGIARVCRARGIPLVVDNAHGAHLRFLEPSLHPINLGADLCCDSLHKSLPVLTGGALLHVSDTQYIAGAKRCMSLFGSTSPSYLIMLSADTALPYLETAFPRELGQVCSRIDSLKQLAVKHGFLLPQGVLDPARLTLGFAPLGYTAEEFGGHLTACGIEPEYLSGSFCVLLASPQNREEDFLRLEKLITTAKRGAPLPVETDEPNRPEQAVSLRRAMFSPAVTIPLEEAEGRVAGSVISPCPPGIPLAIPGERIDASLLYLLKKGGILDIPVLK